MTPGARWQRGLAGAVLVCVLNSPCAVRAAQWTFEHGARATADYDTPSAAGDNGSSKRSLSANFSLARGTEAGEIRAAADLSRDASSTNGGLSLRQRMNLPRQSWTADASVQRDSPQDRPRTASDLLSGARARTVRDASLGWSYALDERWSAQLGGSRSATRLDNGAVAGGGFNAGSASASLNYALSETDSLGLSLARSKQTPALGDGGSTVDTLRLSGSRGLSEASSVSFNLGHSQTTRRFTVASLVCPLPLQFCQAGFAPFVLVQSNQSQRSRQMQFGANFSRRWSETASLGAQLTRVLTPSALGLTREDALGLNFGTSWSEYRSGSLNYDESHSSALGASGAPAAILRTLAASFSQRLTEKLSLSARLQQRRFEAGAPRIGVTSRQISISLQYQGDTVTGWH